MPKIVSEQDKQIVKELIGQHVIQLIRRKNLLKITVDDITQAVGMGKGSFYSYYTSKEECLYEVIRNSEHALFDEIEKVQREELSFEDAITKVLNEIFLGVGSIVLYVTPNDLDSLLKKLPSEHTVRQAEKAVHYYERTLELLQLDRGSIDMEVLGCLTDSLHFIATKQGYSDKGRRAAIEILIKSIVAYMTSGRKQQDGGMAES